MLDILDNKIKKSFVLPFFKGYIAVDKRGVEKFIATIYSTLLQDVKKARKYIESKEQDFPQPTEKIKTSKSKFCDYLYELEHNINSGFQFATYAIVKIKEIENILDKIHDNLPEELTETENLSEE